MRDITSATMYDPIAHALDLSGPGLDKYSSLRVSRRRSSPLNDESSGSSAAASIFFLQWSRTAGTCLRVRDNSQVGLRSGCSPDDQAHTLFGKTYQRSWGHTYLLTAHAPRKRRSKNGKFELVKHYFGTKWLHRPSRRNVRLLDEGADHN